VENDERRCARSKYEDNAIIGKAKYIFFGDEILERLEKEDNMSKLINKCLKNHYDEQDGINLTRDQVEKKIKLLDLELEYNAKKRLIENGR
jgi:hypothetical protein